MTFSPEIVISLLVKEFGNPITLPDILPRDEQRLATSISNILRENIYSTLEIQEDSDLEVEVDTHDSDWELYDSMTLDPSERNDDMIYFGEKGVTKEQVTSAISFYRSSMKGTRTFECMQKRFRFIRGENDMVKLRRIENTGKIVDSRRTNYRRLATHLLEEVNELFGNGVSLHASDLRIMALRINKTHALVEGFKASHSWIQGFKMSHRIVSRNITTFVTRKSFSKKSEIEQNAKDFVDGVKKDMQSLSLDVMCNADQSAFLKELHPARSLAPMGVKKVERIVQSSTAITHSYTILPIIRADGSMGNKLYVVLQERGGIFPHSGHFQAPNLVVSAGSSHIMTKRHMLEWFEKCIFDSPLAHTYLVVDSWSSFRDWESIKATIPANRSLTIRHIPPGTTSMIQPLDLFFFGPMKQMMRRVTNYVITNNFPFSLQTRDHILMVISLLYRQVSSPRFRDFIRYSWYKGGYVDQRPGPFETPLEFSFPKDLSDICASDQCSNYSFLRCAHCLADLCFNHFIVQYHKC